MFLQNCVVIQSAELVPIEGSEEFEHPTEYFLGEDALEKLGMFLFFGEESLLASRKNHNIWAHNGGRFDWFPILGKYVEKGTTPSNVVISGNTIKEFRVGNVRFLDTKMFIPTALSKFTEIFDLVAKKGHFPHHFNLPENFGHVGDIPDIDQFDKRIRETVEFREWHAEWRARNARGEKWSFWKELVDYCEGDVLLLRTGFEKFSYEIKELTGLEPA